MLIQKIIHKLSKNSLNKKKNVVGTGTGYKITDGKVTNKECVLVGVSRKQKRLSSKDLVPKKIYGVETDVIEVGELEHLWRKKHRPMKIGASCCWIGLPACSAGLPVYGKDGQPYLLMNKHCIMPFGSKVGDDVVNPGPIDGVAERIGEVTEIFFPEDEDRKDNIDYALVKLDKPMEHEDVEGNTYLEELHTPIMFDKITKGSRTTQDVRTASSGIISTDFEANVRHSDGKILTYSDCIFVFNIAEDDKPFVEGGCSSSIGFIKGKPSVQTFAGSPVVAIFNDIQKTLDDIYFRFGLELSLKKPEEGWIALGSWMTFNRLTITIKSPARLRDNPGLDTETLSILQRGTKLQLVGESIIKDNYKWVKVKLC